MRAPSRAASLTVVLALGVAMSASAQELAAPAPVAAPPAKPEPPELSLTWQAPATCPAPADVEAQFARLLGGAARVPTGKHVTATAAVHVAGPGRWILELTTVLDGAGGKRNLSGDSCASVASAAALILALMIDPAAAERAGVAEAPPPPPPKPAPPPPTIVAPPPPPARPFLQPSARAFLGGVFLLLPEPTLAAGVAVGARHGHVAAELTFLATTERRGETAAGVGGDFRLLAGGARACGVLGQRVLYQLCLGGELERLAGVGSALEPPQGGPPKATMLAGTGSGLVSIPLTGPLALTIELGVAARTYRPTFTATVADVITPVFRVPAVSASGAAGLSLSL
jgi:hypothetical protein